jgi:peptidoglycan hydrolase CwlO-like protein
MTQLFIQLVQSVTGAVITIVALLLVAVLIGYLTAWFYAKSVYTPIIKGLEAEKADLLKQVAGLKDEISKLNGKVDKLNEKISKLEEEIAEKDKEIKHLKKPKK